MSYFNYKYEYILDRSIYYVDLDKHKKIYFIDFYRNCSNFCAICFYQKIDDIKNFKIFINVSAPYYINNIIKDSDELFIGLQSDPYQPAEYEHKLLKISLEIIKEKKIPLTIITKSDLILRDLLFLTELSKKVDFKIIIKILSMNKNINKIFEKNCVDSNLRLKIIEKLAKQNINVGLGIIPIIPEIVSKTDIVTQIRNSKKRGASFLIYDYLKLNEQNKNFVLKLVQDKFPEKKYKFEELMHNPDIRLKYIQEMDEFISEIADFHKMKIERFQYEVY